MTTNIASENIASKNIAPENIAPDTSTGGAPIGAGTPSFPQQPYAARPATAYSAPLAQAKTNVLAIVTLVLGVLGFGVVPVVTGHIALAQIKRTGEDGRAVALGGLVLGYIALAGWLLAAAFWIVAGGIALLGAFANWAY
jgi:hypothetical protein